MAAIPRLKAYRGPALLSYGFRPFFFFGGCYAALAIAIWLPVFEGEIALATSFAPRDWHVHEMLFGYVAAVLTGFLLTAIPNWTGRLPLQGTPLLVLLIVWLAGRFAIAWSARLGWATVALVDCAFLALVALAVSREIIAGQNWRNLKVLGPVCVLLLANIGFHTEAHTFGVADVSARAAIAAIVILIMLIGGRIVPSFTGNWLSRKNPGRLPAPFGRFDMISIAVSAAALCLWVAMPEDFGRASHCVWQACFNACASPAGLGSALHANPSSSFFTLHTHSFLWVSCFRGWPRLAQSRTAQVCTRGWLERLEP